MTLVGYRGGWDRRCLAPLLPGAFGGIAIGSFVLAHLSAPALARAIGAFALLFGALQYFRDRWRTSEKPVRFHPAIGVAIGFGAGVCSTLSHARTQTHCSPIRSWLRTTIGCNQLSH